jgi:hypothetical protein
MVKIRTSILTLLAVILILSPQTHAQSQNIAFVLEKSGPWKVAGHVVVKGMGLFPGQVLRLDTSSGSGRPARITILYNNGDKISCPSRERPKACIDLTVETPVRQTSASGFAKVFSMLQKAFNSDSESVPGLSKSESIPDGYAEVGGKNIVIKCPGLPAGNLNLQLEFLRLDQEGQVGPAILAKASWKPGSAIDVDLMPGFYRVNILGSDSRPTGDYFLVLAVPLEQGKKLAENFQSLVAESDRWGQEGQETAFITRRMFLWQSAKDMGLLGEK